MNELIEKYFKGNLSSVEKKQLFALIEMDVNLKKEFISTQNLYAVSSLLPDKEDESRALPKLKQFKQKRLERTAIHLFRHIARYAAAVCLAVLLTWAYMKQPAPPADEPVIAWQELVTPPGQRAMVKLADGTTVWLNARSSLRYPAAFAKTERKVELDGEAYFDVEHKDEQPFIVSTEKLTIKVLGTEFNVHAYKGRNEFNAALIKGSVKIYNKGHEENALFISPNEYVELIDNRLVKKEFGNTDFLLWKEGIYAFDDVAFTEIIHKLELYYDVTIQIANEKLSTYQFTGKFRQRDGVESVLRTLQKVYYFRFTKDEENNVITIR
ncbi:MAG: FecR domain-containing protein [Tannerellaceae bacterium]|jgi:ferric-dicitrate binding protein FerR (iron transport regulator)|nr:FecR domain-containing protein [Tannerellaceae bacterium]